MENEKFCFELTAGPFSDETHSYDVTFLENATLRDLLRFVSKRNEWGDVHLGSSCLDPIIVKYAVNGKLYVDHELPISILDKKLKTVKANGGWSYMSYYVTLEEEDNRHVE